MALKMVMASRQLFSKPVPPLSAGAAAASSFSAFTRLLIVSPLYILPALHVVPYRGDGINHGLIARVRETLKTVMPVCHKLIRMSLQRVAVASDTVVIQVEV